MILPRNHKEGGLSVPLFELKSLSQTCVLENATDDYRSARKVGQFRIGEKAAGGKGEKRNPVGGNRIPKEKEK